MRNKASSSLSLGEMMPRSNSGDNDDGTPDRSKGLSRLVQFYQLKQVAKEYKEPTSKKIIEALAEIDFGSTFLKTSGGLVRLQDKTPEGSKHVHLALWLSRNDVCGREKEGVESGLGLDPESRLLEKAHAIFFDDAYLAFLYNHRAAHVEQIANFLNTKCGAAVGHLKVRPWVSADTKQKIKDTNSVNLVKFKVFRQQRAGSAKGLSPVAALQTAFNDVDYYEMEIVLRGFNNKNDNFNGTVMPMLKGFLRSSSINRIFGSLSVRGRGPSGRRQEIDFFKDRLVTRVGNFRYDDDGRIADDSAFEQLTKVYTELSGELSDASAVEIDGLDDDGEDE